MTDKPKYWTTPHLHSLKYCRGEVTPNEIACVGSGVSYPSGPLLESGSAMYLAGAAHCSLGPPMAQIDSGRRSLRQAFPKGFVYPPASPRLSARYSGACMPAPGFSQARGVPGPGKEEGSCVLAWAYPWPWILAPAVSAGLGHSLCSGSLAAGVGIPAAPTANSVLRVPCFSICLIQVLPTLNKLFS